MSRLAFLGVVAAVSLVGVANADPVGLSAYVDANGFIDVTALTCATSPTPIRGTPTS